MIRAAFAVLLLLAAPTEAATRGDCVALLERLGIRAKATALRGDACVFTDLRPADGAARWRAARLVLSGDVDALPDALPDRLTGGVTGFVSDPSVARRAGLAALAPQRSRSGMSLTFDLASQGGSVRLNALTLRSGDAGEITATARLSGLPEVWPPEPAALATARLEELDATFVFGGLFEELMRAAVGLRLLGPDRPAEPQVADFAAQARDWLAGLAGTALAGSAVEADAFLDTLPRPRGNLRLSTGGRGLMLVQFGALAGGSASPEFLARVLAAAEAELTWDPDAP